MVVPPVAENAVIDMKRLQLLWGELDGARCADCRNRHAAANIGRAVDALDHGWPAPTGDAVVDLHLMQRDNEDFKKHRLQTVQRRQQRSAWIEVRNRELERRRVPLGDALAAIGPSVFAGRSLELARSADAIARVRYSQRQGRVRNLAISGDGPRRRPRG